MFFNINNLFFLKKDHILYHILCNLSSIIFFTYADYEYGAPHKVFENKLHQDFKAESINQKWCTDFT